MAKHWYRIDVVEGDKTRAIVGTSELDPLQLVQNPEKGKTRKKGQKQFSKQ